jgi:uncharacterized protein YbbC (DUF1343 family)
VRWVTGGANTQNGIDVLAADDYAPLRRLRIAVVTDSSAIDRLGNPTIDLLRSAREVNVVQEPGECYENVDAVVLDSGPSTLASVMQAVSGTRLTLIVLDRVNPIGGTVVEGPMEGALPLRHGMTIGEIARMWRDETKLTIDLSVIPLSGWSRGMWQDEAGLPWVFAASEAAELDGLALSSGMRLLGNAVSVGRGTATPFEIVGAPDIDGRRLSAAMIAARLPGVTFQPVRFVPASNVFQGRHCEGVKIIVTDRKALRAVDVGLTLASVLLRDHTRPLPPERLPAILRDAAMLDALRTGDPLRLVRPYWATEGFLLRRAKYLMY